MLPALVEPVLLQLVVALHDDVLVERERAGDVPVVELVVTALRAERAALQLRREDVVLAHPAQVDVINDAFSPSADELAHAQAVIDAFAANPDAGTLQLEGKMIDRPHLIQAQRILSLARQIAERTAG